MQQSLVIDSHNMLHGALDIPDGKHILAASTIMVSSMRRSAIALASSSSHRPA